MFIIFGKGEGVNWWCVLFFFLCFLDFLNGEVVKVLELFEEELKEEKEKLVVFELKFVDKIDDKLVESKEFVVKIEI